LKNVVSRIFSNVQYWQDKQLLLRAIPAEYYSNKRVMLQLLGITSDNVSGENDAKKDMWNHQVINYNMGDDLLKNMHPEILDDQEFAKMAIGKYNRTYIYLSKRLRASKELALQTAKNEQGFGESSNFAPILQYMPDIFQLDNEVSVAATTRNIENLQYARNLKSNKYFIIDIMNLLYEDDIKQKVLQYIDQDLLNDKRFISKLGCFDNLCDNFHGDIDYVAHAVAHDIGILKKTDIFDESILVAALNNTDYSREELMAKVFRYIERFNSDYMELDSKIKDKTIMTRLFWDFGEIIADEFT